MASFESRVHALRIEPHPNADRLELAAVGGFRCVVGKASFTDGDLAAYIPEGAVCPDWLITELGLEGRLAGSKKNRVKAVKLRGTLSQGLVYPVRDGMVRGRAVAEGDEVTELLELVKYEPPIPVAMQGEVRAVHGATLRYDIENVKKHPDELAGRRAGGDDREAPRHMVLPGLAPEARTHRDLQGSLRPGPGTHHRRRQREQPLRAHVAGLRGGVRDRARTGRRRRPAVLRPRGGLRPGRAGPALRRAESRVPGLRRLRRPAGPRPVPRTRGGRDIPPRPVPARAGAVPGTVQHGGDARSHRRDHRPRRESTCARASSCGPQRSASRRRSDESSSRASLATT